MSRYVSFLDRFKYHLIMFTTLLVAVFSISLKDLAYEGSYRIWFDEDSQIMQSYDDFRDTFSGDDTFVVSFKDEEGIFTPKAIDTILDLTAQFQSIDGVQKVDSLTNYQFIDAVEDDLIVEDFIYDHDKLESKREIAIDDDLIVDQLISKDAKTTMIAVRLAEASSGDEEVNIYVFETLQKILDAASYESGYKFYISGAPAITASLVTISQGDAMLLMPLAVIVVVLLLFIFFRSFMGILVPSVVVVFTFLLVLSIQMLLGYKLNNFTVNIPSFVTAIAIADTIHLYVAWIYYKMQGLGAYKAVEMALKKNIMPIGLTSFTTAVGFASLGLSDIEPISTLGIAITSGALLAFIFSITIAPAILLTLKDDYHVKPVRFLNFLHISGYGEFIKRYDKKIVLIALFLFVIIGYGLSFVKVDSNSIKYFSSDTTVRSGSDFIQKHLTGPMIYEVIIDSKTKEGAKNPHFLEKITAFERALKAEFAHVRFSTSLKDIIKRMQRELNSEANETIPKNQNLIAQYLLLYSMSLPQGMEINDKIDTHERYLRLTINTDLVDTSKDIEMIAWVKEWWQYNSSYSADVQGQTAIFAYMQSSITETLITSISVTLLIVAVVMFLIFRNIKMLWLFVLPNIAPIILVAGVMGYLGISIDIGVAISAAVILGIAVDDTIHFFSKYFDAIQERSFEESVDYIINHSGNAMILTTVILSATFALFGASSFIPNVNFAIVTVIALNLALLLDLVLLPALLSLLYHRDASDYRKSV
ncbi:MAG: MMPL family transporter [Epsilonproteobacteria bacterium]|nr:MMPL family transporter [Campylobacterota bacterium]